MATNDPKGEENQVILSAIGPARHLRVMRVESQYRNETRLISRLEQEKHGNMLWNLLRMNLGPSMTIADLVGVNQDGKLGYEQEKGMSSNLAYYHKHGDPAELIPVLKFFTAHLMKQARREDDQGKQEFLLYKAIDMARMIVQYSPMSANGDAESVVFSIYIALGTDAPARFAHVMKKEEMIYQQMRHLENTPQEIPLRMEIADALADQGSHFDALVQYRLLLRLMVRRGPGSNKSRSWVIARMGDLFQNLSDISTTQLKDGRKLSAFIERYNWDFSEKGEPLPTLDTLTKSNVNQVRRALLAEANRWHQQAVNSNLLERRLRVRIAGRMGENLNELKQFAKSLTFLEECFPLWGGVETTKKSLQEKLSYLELAYKAAAQTKNQSKLGWVSRETATTNSQLSELEKAERDRQHARAALLG